MTARLAADRIPLADAAAAFDDLLVADRVRQRGLGAPPSAAPAAEAEEPDRIRALRRYDILDSPPEETYDRVTRLAARTLHVPFAAVSIVDVDRVWFKSRSGVAFDQVDRNESFCVTTAPSDVRPWSVPDALADPRTKGSPFVLGDPFVRAYAAAPLITHDGHRLGALCVFDQRPRRFGVEELDLLSDLAGVVMNELELRLASRRALFAR
jgi:eukaryotic-like serine/threonine-protein kinase